LYATSLGQLVSRKKSETCLQLVADLLKVWFQTCSKPGFKQVLSKIVVMEIGP